MARCRCAGSSCSCNIQSGPGITVVGNGEFDNPFIISAAVEAPNSRTSASMTTLALTPGATESGGIQIGPGYRLLSIETSEPARVRLYTSDAGADADRPRPIGTPPTGNHGLVLEFVTTAGMLSADLTPAVAGFTTGGPTSPALLWVPTHITNMGTNTAPVVVTFVYLKTEEPW